MIENKGEVLPMQHHYLRYILLGVIFVFILIFGIFYFWDFDEEVTIDLTCGDSTFYETCSITKPYYCSNGTLISKSTLCGCGDGMKEGEFCVFEYGEAPSTISLKYVLRGNEGLLNFVTYGGVASYLQNISRIVTYHGNEEPSRRDFHLLNLNEPVQKKFLMPLVKEIQNLAKSKDDQARIAISIVQNIGFGSSNKTVIFAGGETEYIRYPYEVLHNALGICEEKADLLVFLLKELGYGTVLYYHSTENHASVGIKCPTSQSYKETGYCFIETTGPSIITDSNIEYVGGITLFTKPDVFLISEGFTFGQQNFYEYEDAKEIKKIYEDMREDGKINFYVSTDLKALSVKYGLGGIYNI